MLRASQESKLNYKHFALESTCPIAKYRLMKACIISSFRRMQDEMYETHAACETMLPVDVQYIFCHLKNEMSEKIYNRY
jgi:hypothetical protein